MSEVLNALMSIIRSLFGRELIRAEAIEFARVRAFDNRQRDFLPTIAVLNCAEHCRSVIRPPAGWAAT